MTSSAALNAAPRLVAFLRFVVEAALSGRSNSIKAYTVAVGALGRRQNFDPATDAIVRVEAVRLRAALAHYYGGAGSADPIIIDLPRGCYIPELRWRGHATRAQRDNGRAMSPSSADALDAGGWEAVYLRHRTLLAECHRHRTLLQDNFTELKGQLARLRSMVQALRL